MPYSDPDPDDPQQLVGVGFPAAEETEEEMAYVIAEEFARLGFDERRVSDLFRNPFYRSAHRCYRKLGEQKIESILRDVFQIWGQVRFVDQDTGDDPLVQLQGLDRDKGER